MCWPPLPAHLGVSTISVIDRYTPKVVNVGSDWQVGITHHARVGLHQKLRANPPRAKLQTRVGLKFGKSPSHFWAKAAVLSVVADDLGDHFQLRL